mgnify:CR=1 FL=1
MHLPFIGIAVGRSAVKAIARQGSRTFSVMFPSAVCIAQAVPFEEIAAAAAVDSVELDGQTYWTGETALTQHWGGEAIGRNDDWVMGLQHDVLVAAALKRLQANPRVTKIRVVVANDCCPVCQSNEGVYDKDKVPPLPTPGCSHHNGCRCTYEPILDQIYP